MNNKPIVSIIIVSYNSAESVKKCINSIGKNQRYEVIVVDNTENNRGFSTACNIGARTAKGSYLYFLNPDTIVTPESIEKLLEAIEFDPQIGIVAPQLLNERKEAYRSYSIQPRWYSFLILNSFVRDYLPQKILLELDPYQNDTLQNSKNVEAVSGAALLIRKKIYEKIGGFDTDFFLYWEDFEICKKVLDLNLKILYQPKAKIIHSGGGATKDKVAAQKLFQLSRYIFMKKRFGVIYAVISDLLLRLSEAI